MNIIQITPGAGKMFCGGCFRDNALVGALRKLGHSVTMLPLYLPLTLDDQDQSQGTPIFFSGINVYLEQKFTLYQSAPDWLRNVFASPKLLKAAAGSAAKTRPEDVGDLMLSMLRGEEGNQARELDELIHWLKKTEKPHVISLSNALLAGMARKLKSELGVPVICSLQGEDFFLDSLPEQFKTQAWQLLSERAADVDLFVAPSRYFGELMSRRLNVPAAKTAVIYNGIAVDPEMTGTNRATANQPSTLGYFARMCREKGMDLLVDAFLLLRQRGKVGHLRLKLGGSCGPADEPFVEEQKRKIQAANLLGDVEFCPNLTREEKASFLNSLDVFSVPAVYGEAFGLYVLEALASGVPVVQPRDAAFPELIQSTGGGLLFEARHVKALADAIESLLLNPAQARTMGKTGRKAVRERFTAERMAMEFAQTCSLLVNRKS